MSTFNAPQMAKSTRLLYPAHGMKRDVERILHDFGACQSLRFSEFTAIWRRMNFSTIHAGRTGHREKREFVEEVFKIVVTYALVPYTLQVRVGAMYLLYSIYHTQRSQPVVQIRMQLTDWPDMVTLHEELVSSGHTDADYIFRKMRDVDQVFCLVASTSTICREDAYQDLDSFVPDDDTQDPFCKIHFAPLTSVMDYDCLSVLQTIHKKYKQGKETYKANQGNQQSLLNLVEKDVIAEIIKLRSGPGTKHKNVANVKRSRKAKDYTRTSRKEITMQAEQIFEMRMRELSCSSSDLEESTSLSDGSPPHWSFTPKKQRTKKISSKEDSHGIIRRQLKEKAFSQSASTSATCSKPHSMLVEGAELMLGSGEDPSGSEDSLWEPHVPKRKKKGALPETPTTSKLKRSRPGRRAKENATVAMQNVIEDDSDDDISNERISAMEYRFGGMKARRQSKWVKIPKE